MAVLSVGVVDVIAIELFYINITIQLQLQYNTCNMNYKRQYSISANEFLGL